MDLREAILTRRSVKHFDPEHELSDEQVRDLVGAACLAPTSYNMQNWHFVAVRDKQRKAAMREASFNQAQVENAALVLVLCGRVNAHEDPSRTLRHAPEELATMFTSMMQGFYRGNDHLAVEEACRSIGFAGQNVMLMAREMGLDSCPMIGFEPGRIAGLLGLPEECPPLLMLTIGKALKPAQGRMGLLDFHEVLSTEQFGQHTIRGEVPG